MRFLTGFVAVAASTTPEGHNDPIPVHMNPDDSAMHVMKCASGKTFDFRDASTTWTSCHDNTEKRGDFVVECPTLMGVVCAVQGGGTTACGTTRYDCHGHLELKQGDVPMVGLEITIDGDKTLVPEVIFNTCSEKGLDNHHLKCNNSEPNQTEEFKEDDQDPWGICKNEPVTVCTNLHPFVCEDQTRGPKCGQTPMHCHGGKATNDCTGPNTQIHEDLWVITHPDQNPPAWVQTPHVEIETCGLYQPVPTIAEVPECKKRMEGELGYQEGVCYSQFLDKKVYVWEVPSDVGKNSVADPREENFGDVFSAIGTQINPKNYRFHPGLYPHPLEISPLVYYDVKKTEVAFTQPAGLERCSGAACDAHLTASPASCNGEGIPHPINPDTPTTPTPEPETEAPEVGPVPVDGIPITGAIIRMETEKLEKALTPAQLVRPTTETQLFYKIDGIKENMKCFRLEKLTIEVQVADKDGFFPAVGTKTGTEITYFEDGCPNMDESFGEVMSINLKTDDGKEGPKGFSLPTSRRNKAEELDLKQRLVPSWSGKNPSPDANGDCPPMPKCENVRRRLSPEHHKLGHHAERRQLDNTTQKKAEVPTQTIPAVPTEEAPKLFGTPIIVPVGGQPTGTNLLALWIVLGLLALLLLLLICFFFMLGSRQQAGPTPFEEDQLHAVGGGNGIANKRETVKRHE